MAINIQPIVEKFIRSVKRHEQAAQPGFYCRVPGGPVNEYGCADAANIRYTLDCMERDPSRRADAVRALQSFQDPETGLFHEPTHVPYHSTAHCIAALELFDAGPLYPLKALERFRTPEGIVGLLEEIDWSGRPAIQGHLGAGVYAALFLTGYREKAWKDAYFSFLADCCDPDWGFGMKGMVATGKPPFRYLNDWFHYLFNHYSSNRPFPQPEKLIDSCLRLFRDDMLGETFDKQCGFTEIDWTFSLNRAVRQTAYRAEEARAALREQAVRLTDFLNSCTELDELPYGEDLHMAFGTLCALAELQLALPGELECDSPLRNVLDRRPFI